MNLLEELRIEENNLYSFFVAHAKILNEYMALLADYDPDKKDQLITTKNRVESNLTMIGARVQRQVMADKARDNIQNHPTFFVPQTVIPDNAQLEANMKESILGKFR